MLPKHCLRVPAFLLLAAQLVGALLVGAGCAHRQPAPTPTRTYALTVLDATPCVAADAVRAAVAERLARDGLAPVAEGARPDVRLTLLLDHTFVAKVQYDKAEPPTIPVDAGCALVNAIYLVGWSAVQGGKAAVNLARPDARIALRVVLHEGDAGPRLALGEAAPYSGEGSGCRKCVAREAAELVATAFGAAQPVSEEDAAKALRTGWQQQDADATPVDAAMQVADAPCPAEDATAPPKAE